jgi:hypothetical protein
MTLCKLNANIFANNIKMQVELQFFERMISMNRAYRRRESRKKIEPKEYSFIDNMCMKFGMFIFKRK